MRLGLIALQLRATTTDFGNKIGGSAELSLVLESTLIEEMAFVIPIAESAPANMVESGISQKITETFGVVVALKNDTSQLDKLGLTAYDRLHDIRTQILKALLGWNMTGAEGLIHYSGGRLLDLNPAWLWYQFEFSVLTRIDDDDGWDNDFDSQQELVSIYTQYVLEPNSQIPISGSLPTELLAPDMTQMIKIEHGFSKGFSSGFDTTAAYVNRNYE